MKKRNTKNERIILAFWYSVATMEWMIFNSYTFKTTTAIALIPLCSIVVRQEWGIKLSGKKIHTKETSIFQQNRVHRIWRTLAYVCMLHYALAYQPTNQPTHNRYCCCVIILLNVCNVHIWMEYFCMKIEIFRSFFYCLLFVVVVVAISIFFSLSLFF